MEEAELTWPWVSRDRYDELQAANAKLQFALSVANERIKQLDKPVDAKGNPIQSKVPPRMTRWQATKRRVEAQLAKPKEPVTAQQVLNEKATEAENVQ